jgi:nicotinate-nucleotide adenylyltransferase
MARPHKIFFELFVSLCFLFLFARCENAGSPAPNGLRLTETFKTIALFGGSFDPPHVAHVLMAGWALAAGGVDEVWAFPTGGHPFGKDSAPFEDRIEMCRRAFACYGERARVLDIEREPRVHYSIDTLRKLAAEHPNLRWRWLIGSDAYAERGAWKEADELFRLAPPLVVNRIEDAAPASRIRPIGPIRPLASEEPATSPAFALPDISSTMLRKILKRGDGRRRSDSALRDLVPRAVLDYIRERGLYRSGE